MQKITVIAKALATKLAESGVEKVLEDKGYIPSTNGNNVAVFVPISTGSTLLSLVPSIGGSASLLVRELPFVLEIVIKRDYLLASKLNQ